MTVLNLAAYCRASTILVLPLAGLLCAVLPARASPLLGAAEFVAVSGAAAVTNTGATAVNGDLGVSPGTSIAGLGSISIVGTVSQNDAAAQRQQADATAAYVSLAAMPFTQDLTGQDLGGLTLTPGVYRFASSAQLTGTLTLDFGNQADQLFVFQVGGALTTSSGSAIDVRNGSSSSGVFFDVGGAATLGTSTVFAGNILADQSITLDTGADILCGRAIALNGAVTLDTNVVSNDCGGGGDFDSGRTDFGSSGLGGDGTPVVNGSGATTMPEPASLALLGMGLVGTAMLGSRRRQAPGRRLG